MVDLTNYANIAGANNTDLLSTKNEIIRQIYEHREKKFFREKSQIRELSRRALREKNIVKDIQLLANINNRANEEHKMIQEMSK